MNHLVSSILHLLGAAAVVWATPDLLRRLGGGREVQAAGLAHALCVGSLLLASGSYHAAMQLLGASHPVTELLVRIDHSAVWLILAGFFILPHLIVQRGAWRWVPLAGVWLAAGLGIGSKALFFVDQTPAEIVVPYALASLIGVASTVKFVTQRGPRAATLLLLFWAAFGSAAACFVLQTPNPIGGWVGFHEVWHLGILVGIGAHWRFVLQLAPEAADAFPAPAPAGAPAWSPEVEAA